MQGRIRSAIIGAGFIGQVHARAVRAAGGEVAWISAASQGEADAAGERTFAQRATADWREALADPEVDVVHVCTPNHLHVEIAAAAIEAGKHVICEKPLAPDAGDAARLVEMAAEAGVVTAVPFVYRFYPTVRDARARVGRGDLGDVRLIHGSYLQDWLSRPGDGNWRVDPKQGGASRAFGDIGVHWCDLAEFVTGQRISRVAARSFAIDRPAGPSLTEDGATVMFETDGGVVGSVVISQVSPGRKNRLWLSVEGAEASAQFDQENPDSLWLGSRGANSVVIRGTEGTAPAAERYNIVPVGHPMGYQDCFTGFVGDVYAAVGGDQVDGLPTFADGHRAAVLTKAFMEAASTQDWIEVAG
ncbi:Gfo/Idh/MocA family protein [Demequina soli]|uniref:Gfo/Idh/MocA family protein n=1 Tax=Demequina soli TaxID=1638987 RepID=UPI0007818544|nr:Gfo/Idh/MocA family oxidoreductase [Demequina soli]